MTQSLTKYFGIKNTEKHYDHIPMTVDLERFSLNKMNFSKTLTYIGYLNDEKDGVNILIKAFTKIIKKITKNIITHYREVPNSIIYESYIRSANELGVPNSNICFYGKVDSDLVPQILSESKLLLLALPNSKQADNGFSTKLGEYLASGIPVIVTSVGEIPKYLKDGESVFIAEPSNIDSFATKIEEALSNYEKATRIGFNGKKVAEKHFNNILQTKKIINFIEQY